MNDICAEHWLVVQEECDSDLTVELYNKKHKIEKVSVSCVHSRYLLPRRTDEGGPLLLHLHPELVVVEETSVEGQSKRRVFTYLCRHCYMAAQKPIGAPPSQSLALDVIMAFCREFV